LLVFVHGVSHFQVPVGASLIATCNCTHQGQHQRNRV
jgi:hypothetical protein